MTKAAPPTPTIASRRRLAVAAGGALGAAARWSVAATAGAVGFDTPAATLTVNVSGAFLLGLVVARHTGRFRASPLLIPFVGVGLLGAFTTFSLFSTEVLALARDGSWALAVVYPIVSVAGGFAAAFLGLRMGARR